MPNINRKIPSSSLTSSKPQIQVPQVLPLTGNISKEVWSLFKGFDKTRYSVARSSILGVNINTCSFFFPNVFPSFLPLEVADFSQPEALGPVNIEDLLTILWTAFEQVAQAPKHTRKKNESRCFCRVQENKRTSFSLH